MINLNKKKNKKSGFTLVEMLVALFIFSVSILAVMSALSQGIAGTDRAKNRIIAESLSQEGVEYFRNMRDTYMLYADEKQPAWVAFKTALIKSSADCENGCDFNNDIEAQSMVGNPNQPMKDLQIFACSTFPNGTCPTFYYHASSGKYNHYVSGGTATLFSRKMTVTQINSPVSFEIRSEVTWGTGAQSFTVSVMEHLSDWIE